MNVLTRLYRGETDIDFIGKRAIWFSISGLLLLISIGSMALRTAEPSCSPPLPGLFKGLACGIEFKGGIQITADVPADGPLAAEDDLGVIEAMRSALEDVGAADAQIQVAGEADDRTVLVQTDEAAEAEERDQVIQVVQETTGASETDEQFISATWGAEITGKAIRALVIFLVVVFLFITFRFEVKMAVAAILALLHDLTITAGVYSIVGFEVTPSTVIAILTILGYSLYDTVVVFDKVEENTEAMAATGKSTYQDAANLALNQVFMRSLNTSLATLLPVGALLFVGAGLLGAETLQDLALALLIGLIVGAYSSVFTATPILSLWKEREPKYRSVREKVLRDAKRGALQPATAGAPTESADVVTATKPPTQSGPSARPKAGSKKSQRRKRR